MLKANIDFDPTRVGLVAVKTGLDLGNDVHEYGSGRVNMEMRRE